MPDAIINHTAAGWPYLDDQNFMDIVDDYTIELAGKLQNSEADVAAAINAANTATTAAASISAQSAKLNRLPYAMAAGAVAAGQKSGASYTHRITFPAGRFTTPPNLAVTIDNAASGTAALQVVIQSRTKDYADLVFMLTSGSLSNTWCTATWIAAQMTPTDSNG